jgi:tetratricopeptide (TPR) repeat protein
MKFPFQLIALALASSPLTLVYASETAPIDVSKLSNICYSSIVANDLSLANSSCEELQKSFHTIEDFSILKLKAATTLGAYLAVNKKTTEAAKLISKHLDSLTEISYNSDAAKIHALNFLGTIYINQKDWKNAGDSLSKAIQIADKLGDRSGVIENLTSLATLKSAMGDHRRALNYAKKTVDYASSFSEADINNRDQVLFSSNRVLAMAYASNNMPDDALKTAITASQYATIAFADKPAAAPLLSINADIASLYISQEKFEEAIPYATKAISSLSDTTVPVSSDVAAALVNLIKIYTHTDRQLQARTLADTYVYRIDAMPESPEKVRALGSLGAYYMRSTNEKPRAKALLMKSAMISYKIFGDSPTTNQLAELAESSELDTK